MRRPLFEEKVHRAIEGVLAPYGFTPSSQSRVGTPSDVDEPETSALFEIEGGPEEYFRRYPRLTEHSGLDDHMTDRGYGCIDLWVHYAKGRIWCDLEGGAILFDPDDMDPAPRLELEPNHVEVPGDLDQQLVVWAKVLGRLLETADVGRP